MKKLKLIRLVPFSIIIVLGMSCGGGSLEGQELTTETGISYEFVKKGSGKVPPEGGFWTLNVDYYNEAGEKMFSSTEMNGGPLTMNYTTNYPKNASIEECLSLVGEGDSAVFYISADSLYKGAPGGRTPAELAGTKIKLHVGIDKVYTSEEYAAMMQEKEKGQFELEEGLIQEYIAANNLQPEKTAEGMYIEISEQGEGELPQPGQNVKVNYTGYLLDGTIFDSSIEEVAKEAGLYNPNRPYGPLEFQLAANQVIMGWDIGVSYLAKGGKAKLIIPSPLAYGKRRMGALIAENSILVFDVELVEIGE